MASATDIDRLADKLREKIELELISKRPRVNLNALQRLQKELDSSHIAFHQAMARQRGNQARRAAEKILLIERQAEQLINPRGPLDIRLDIGRRD